MMIENDHLLLKSFFVNVTEASLLLRAINNKIRQNILKLLEQHGKLTVTEIMVHLRQEQSITSQHLAILRRKGIVITTRQGKCIFYELNESRIHQVHHFIELLLR